MCAGFFISYVSKRITLVKISVHFNAKKKQMVRFHECALFTGHIYFHWMGSVLIEDRPGVFSLDRRRKKPTHTNIHVVLLDVAIVENKPKCCYYLKNHWNRRVLIWACRFIERILRAGFSAVAIFSCWNSLKVSINYLRQIN